MQHNRLTYAGCVRSDGDDSFFFKQKVSYFSVKVQDFFIWKKKKRKIESTLF